VNVVAAGEASRLGERMHCREYARDDGVVDVCRILARIQPSEVAPEDRKRVETDGGIL